MGIISKTSSGVKVEPKPFPKLMKSNVGTVVLFSSKTEGTVVAQNSGLYQIGHYADNWAPEGFKDYDGTVHLSNE